MTDVLPAVAGLLNGLADISLAYRDGFTSLPCIVLAEIGNSSSVILSGADRYSSITLQLDVYAGDEADVRALAVEANDVLAAKGMKRSFAQFITDEDVPRMCMRYRFGLDEATGRVVSV